MVQPDEIATPSRGARRFNRWIDEECGSGREAARVLGFDAAMVSRWRRGLRTPVQAGQLRIRDCTKRWKRGPIEPREWGMR